MDFHPVEILYRVPVVGVPLRKKKPMRCWVRELVHTALRSPGPAECRVVATVEHGEHADFIDIGHAGPKERYLHFDGAFWCDHVRGVRVFPDARQVDISEAVFDVIAWNESPDEWRHLSDIGRGDRRPSTYKAGFPVWWALHRQRPGQTVPRNRPDMTFACANLLDGMELLREVTDPSRIIGARQVAERVASDVIAFEGRVFVRCPMPTFRAQPRFEICPLTSVLDAPDYPFSAFEAVRTFYWEHQTLARHQFDPLMRCRVEVLDPDVFEFDEVGLYGGFVAAKMIESLSSNARTLASFSVADFMDFCVVRDQRGKGLYLAPDVGIEAYIAAMAGVVRGILRARDLADDRRPDLQDETLRSFRTLVRYAMPAEKAVHLLQVSGLMQPPADPEVSEASRDVTSSSEQDVAELVDGPPEI